VIFRELLVSRRQLRFADARADAREWIGIARRRLQAGRRRVERRRGHQADELRAIRGERRPAGARSAALRISGGERVAELPLRRCRCVTVFAARACDDGGGQEDRDRSEASEHEHPFVRSYQCAACALTMITLPSRSTERFFALATTS